MIVTMRGVRRVVVAVVGATVVLTGLILLVFPGPGWLVIFGGLALLGTEFVWARRLLRRARQEAGNLRERARR